MAIYNVNNCSDEDIIREACITILESLDDQEYYDEGMTLEEAYDIVQRVVLPTNLIYSDFFSFKIFI